MGIPEDIAQFEHNLGQLVIRYEQYFLGMEKRAPLKLLDDVELCARRYANVPIVNTMHKFQYNSLVARLCSYKQYWTRVNRLIEEGKYSRDRFKLDMHSGGKGKVKLPEPPPREDEVSSVYRQYIEARKACNLPVDSVTPEMITSALERQKPAIIAKYNCSDVEFKVVIEQGAPKIKVRPRK